MYLYGIEIVSRLLSFRNLISVQIVPLWNWNMANQGESGDVARSNCTFMELKLRLSSWLPRLVSLFKLYLYGIEINYKYDDYLFHGVQIVPLWNWNAHGIRKEMQPISVQIVPLWNWNRHQGWQMPSPKGFKLYLYGIEIPLFRGLFKRYAGSNCTFMELKYGRNVVIKGNEGVQIVPLWNWNCGYSQSW